MLDVSAEEDFQAKLQEADFGTATSALTILRYHRLHCSPSTLKPYYLQSDGHALLHMNTISCLGIFGVIDSMVSGVVH